MNSYGYLIGYRDRDIQVRLNDTPKSLTKFKGSLVELNFNDRRGITNQQRKKIFSLIGEIDEHIGNFVKPLTEDNLKYDFCLKIGYYHYFSLSDCSVEFANRFINYLIDFCLANEIPFTTKLLDEIKDTNHYEYYCLMTHKCCICLDKSQIAHYYAVGIGKDRTKTNHVGNYVMPLCNKHHREQHSTGIVSFVKKYKLKGVKVTPKVANLIGLESKKQLREDGYQLEEQDPINLYRSDK